MVLILLISLDVVVQQFLLDSRPTVLLLTALLGLAMSSAMEKLFAVPLVGTCYEMFIEGDPNLKHIWILYSSISLDYCA